MSGEASTIYIFYSFKSKEFSTKIYKFPFSLNYKTVTKFNSNITIFLKYKCYSSNNNYN